MSENDNANEAAILDALYEGVADPTALERALRASMGVLNADGVNLHFIKKSNLETLFFKGVGSGYSDESISNYLDHWQYVNAHRDAMRRAYRPDRDVVFLCHEHISEQDWARGAYFQEFFATLGQRWLAGGVVWSGEETEIAIAFSRTKDAGQFAEPERAFLTMLFPHLRRASRVALKLAAGGNGPRAGLEGGLGATRTPSFLVDNDARVQWMNNAGKELLEGGGALSLSDGRLASAGQAESQMFRQLLSGAIEKNLANTPPGLMRIEGESGALEMEILPATVPAGALIGASALALVMVRMVGLAPGVSDSLKERYSLTDAECRLALALADGASLEHVAKEGGVSPHTVRTHLRSIFSKTGVNRQSALAALIWKTA